MMEILFTWAIPMLGAGGLGIAIGFMSRNHRIDQLQSEIWSLRAAARRSEPAPRPAERTAPARTAAVGTRQARSAPDHAATRTAPLPPGVAYVVTAEGDEGFDDRPMSDHEYAELMRSRASSRA